MLNKINLSSELLFRLLITVFIVTWYVFHQRTVPFYFNWDTDAFVVIDMVLIGSTLLPEHINHPSYGLFVLFTPLLSAINYFLPVGNLGLSLSDFQYNCEDPLGCLTRTTNTLHDITRVLFCVSMAFFTISFSKLFQSRLLGFVILLALLFDEGIIYSQHILKSEGFSVCFFMISVAFFANYITTHRRIYFLLGSFFVGLVFFTKTQFLLYSVFLCCMAGLLPTVLVSRKQLAWLAGFIFVICLSIGTVAIEKFGNTVFWLELSFTSSIYATAICLMFLIWVFNVIPWLGRFNASAINNVSVAALIAFSSILSTVIINGPDLGFSLSAQAVASSMMHITSSANFTNVDYEIFLEPTRLFFMFICSGLSACAGFLVLRNRKSVLGNKIVNVILLVCVLLLPVLNVFLSFRGIYRDLMPAKSLLMFSAIISLGIIYYFDGFKYRGRHVLVILSSVLLLLCQVSLQRLAMPNLISENAHYGGSPYHFHTGAYGGNHDVFKSALDQAGLNTNLAPAQWLKQSTSQDFQSLLPNVVPGCLEQKSETAAKEVGELMSIGHVWAAAQSGFFEIVQDCLRDITISAGWVLNNDVSYPVAKYRGLTTTTRSGALELMPRRDMRTVIVSPTKLKIDATKFYDVIQNARYALPEQSYLTKIVDGEIWHVYLFSRYVRIPIQERVYVGFYPST